MSFEGKLLVALVFLIVIALLAVALAPQRSTTPIEQKAAALQAFMAGEEVDMESAWWITYPHDFKMPTLNAVAEYLKMTEEETRQARVAITGWNQQVIRWKKPESVDESPG